MARNALKNVVIVLVGTKYAGNVGAVARAMHNMGLEQLRLVAPECSINEEAVRLARSGEEVLARARLHPSLKSALRAVGLTVGTTGKTGGHRDHAQAPRTLAPRIAEQAARQKVAIVFGPEDTGLVDEDLLFCQLLSRIPTRPNARSLNLAQAVMILCYELHLASLKRKPARGPRLAPVEQVEAMYDHLRTALLRIGFLHEKNARHMMFALRRLFGRAGLEKTDVAMLRGIARQIDWYARAAAGDNPDTRKNYIVE